MSQYLYDRFEFTDAYKNEVIELIRHNTNAEIGGYRIYDGQGTHLMQNPYEFADYIFALKRIEQETGQEVFPFFSEGGFGAGINNTILNKF